MFVEGEVKLCLLMGDVLESLANLGVSNLISISMSLVRRHFYYETRYIHINDLVK